LGVELGEASSHLTIGPHVLGERFADTVRRFLQNILDDTVEVVFFHDCSCSVYLIATSASFQLVA
jgi:hypothetical protein